MKSIRSDGASRYLPQMVLATTLVVLVPALSAWWLRDRGLLPSALACLLFCILLSIGLSVAGAAYWKRRSHSADIMFSELLLWGWARRLWRERQLRNVPALLESAANGHQSDQLTVQRRKRLLAQLAAAIEAQDPFIDGHSRRVARHSAMIAAKMRLPAEQVARIRTAGALHDVGKLSTPTEVLSKPGRLTDREFEVVKHHAREGALMVTCLEDPELTAMVACHHERLDGSGYPDGLEAERIPLGARIVAVADIFDAITAPRPYRPAASHQRAFAVLWSEAGTRLDPEVVQAFVRCYSGRRTVALWAALSGLAASALARSKGLLARRRLSLRDLLGTMTAAIAAAVAALAVPLSAPALHRPTPPPRAAAAAPTIISPAADKRRVAGDHAFPPSAVSPVTPAVAAQLAPGHRSATVHPGSHLAPVAHTAPPPPSSPHMTPPPHQPPARRTPTTTTTTAPPQTSTTAPPPRTTTTTTTTTATTTTTTTTAAPPPTSTAPSGPTSKEQCMNGGFVQFGFPNQGQCIAWVQHHRG